MTAARLDRAARADALRAIGGRRLDVLIVGGGITGIGAALDAASRGLDVGLVERGDFASGTSSKSTKLIHGGLRYLQTRDFALVREALRERELLMARIAPHLVRPVAFLLPVRDSRQRAYFGAGVALYDLLGGRTSTVPHHRHLTRSAAERAAPALRRDALGGAIRYFDAQLDDARYAITLLRTAVAHGAHAASRVRVTGFLGERSIEGVTLEDGETGDVLEARARVTVLAAGVWCHDLEALARAPAPIPIRASKGVHILVPRDRIALEDALILRTDRSVLLVVPWNGHWLIGTTDTPWTAAFDEPPTASPADVTYLLQRLNAVLRQPLTEADVTGVFAGLRPLVDTGRDDTAKISREHVVRRARPGLVTVAGGKYTTYRVMAAAAIDAAAAEIGAAVPKSRTAAIPLLGAKGLDEARRKLDERGLDSATSERLIGRYGSLATSVAELMPDDGESSLAAEAAYAVTHEGALRIEDVLARRTRIAIEAPDGGASAATQVAEIMRGALGWTAERTADEVAAYAGWLRSERASNRDGDCPRRT